MTRDEIAARFQRQDAHIAEIMDMDQPTLRQFLSLLGWQDREYAYDLEYLIVHLRNLVMMYGHVLADTRGKTRDPEILRDIDFCLAFDDLGRPKLDKITESRFREMRSRAWTGILRSSAEKQQREEHRDN